MLDLDSDLKSKIRHLLDNMWGILRKLSRKKLWPEKVARLEYHLRVVRMKLCTLMPGSSSLYQFG